MSFIHKYQKISDKVSKYSLDKKDNKLFSNKSKWIVTEKVHGKKRIIIDKKFSQTL